MQWRVEASFQHPFEHPRSHLDRSFGMKPPPCNSKRWID
jgi:hypothetical protein